ncbi:proteinase inhibitor I36 SMPI [Streptomyces sp. NBC_00555]|uniref:proteinase inhibitor I36 SMPI n=1 Tax=Streptomyces sp. NBC_00555 TaxID=2903662 RepID=UPI00224E8684|nr:proteinase inhibitor I36 SMPI [Streptomyces sp. NBC_00555]MCX5014907.1 proteinase inhibitor I36 SMPI [Streptomyces sp. NBC_00555]
MGESTPLINEGLTMAWIRKATLAVSALAMTGGSLAATAAPAAAVGGCPEYPIRKLCLYDSSQYRNLAITSTSTKACIDLVNGPNRMPRIRSYVNNLNRNAVVWKQSGFGLVVQGTIGPGGHSSDAGWDFGTAGAVCMGGVNPNN